MKTYQKSDPKMEPKSIKNHSKIDAKKKTKKEGLKLYKPSSAECASSPNPIISKDILRSEVRRKQTKKTDYIKGEYRVECKKWSAKGKCRKASADREPTQDLNTLGGQRPRADSERKRAFRRARF